MELNGFGVTVPQGKETPEGYVELEHGTKYTLALKNTRSVRCDARVEIDGKHVGSWRVKPNTVIVLERPLHNAGKFTFYRVGTVEADKLGMSKSNPERGLLRVQFIPELKEVDLFSKLDDLSVNFEESLESQFAALESGSDAEAELHADLDAELEAMKAELLGPLPMSSQQTDVNADPELEALRIRLDLPGPATTSRSPSRSVTAGTTGLSGKSEQKFVDAQPIKHDFSQTTIIHLRLVAPKYSPVSNPVPPPIE